MVPVKFLDSCGVINNEVGVVGPFSKIHFEVREFGELDLKPMIHFVDNEEECDDG